MRGAQADHGHGAETKGGGIDRRAVAGDDAALLQPLHPFRGGGLGQANAAAEFGNADAAILLHDLDDRHVGGIEPRPIIAICHKHLQSIGILRRFPMISHSVDEEKT